MTRNAWRGSVAASAVSLWLTPAAVLAQTPAAKEEWVVESPARLLERANIVPESPALIKSLGDAAEYVSRWKLPGDAEGWQRRRPEVERAFREAIGLREPPERTPLNARVVARHNMGDYLLENVVFESRPGFPVTANMYRPKAPSSKKRPAILCPIGHYLSQGKATLDVQARCIRLAQSGFIVLVYDAIGQGERMTRGNAHHEGGYALLPLGETIAGWMVWDSIRGIDYLLTLEDVDRERIGVTGNSGGGLNTLFTAALDCRVRAAVVVGYTFEFGNWLKYGGAHCSCTHLPGLFRSMEWFEIAGLIAPRALMMLQGENDSIFPISGARRAGHNTEALYALLGRSDHVQFSELAEQPHAYSCPFRERMYGWMTRHLLGQGSGEPIPEGNLQPLREDDPRLRCDPDGSILAKSPSVVDLARRKAIDAVSKLPASRSQRTRDAAGWWMRELTAPPEPLPHYQAAHTVQTIPVPGGRLEKISFISEDGQYIPGLLWLPSHPRSPAEVVLMVDDRGKGAVAESGLVQPLVQAGFAVFSVDLRGRGEISGRVRQGRDGNFRLTANQVLFGRPLAGRRAFDLVRAVDYLGLRKDLAFREVVVVGLGDDALPALLAAASDTRFRRVAVARYFHSFVSQMRTMAPHARSEMPQLWNSAQVDGRIHAEDDDIDLGSVIPSALKYADIPDIAALVAPRSVLFCEARDHRAPAVEALTSRFHRVIASVERDFVRYEPGRTLNAELLLEWLGYALETRID
ncbi:MAG TPA: acetylxylan esterase [Bryobacteraceae bacterium]|nr:acetylxylan esterase [Bryobacteraceae bacterium]